MECTHVLSLVMPDKYCIDEHLYSTTLCFPVTAQPDRLMCSHLGQRKIFLNCCTSSRLICNSTICSGMWDDKSCKYISYPYPSTTFVYNGCLSKLGHDGCDGKESGDQTALVSVSTTVFGENASWVLNAHSTKVSSMKSWLRYFRSFS